MNRGLGKEMVKMGQNYRVPTVQSMVNSNHPIGGKSGIMELRRQAGRCFKCGEIYAPGHQCRKQLLMLEEEEEEEIG